MASAGGLQWQYIVNCHIFYLLSSEAYDWCGVSGENCPFLPVHVVSKLPVIMFTETVDVVGRQRGGQLNVLVRVDETGSRRIKPM